MTFAKLARSSLLRGACVAALAAPGAAAALDRRPVDPCAAHGPGFASVGGGACMKIGGRVRVEFGTQSGSRLSDWRVAPAAGSASRASMPDFAPAADAPQHRLKPSRKY